MDVPLRLWDRCDRFVFSGGRRGRVCRCDGVDFVRRELSSLVLSKSAIRAGV